MRTLPPSCNALASYAQFILWKAVWDVVKGKYIKKPIDPATGWTHSYQDRAIWCDVYTAMEKLRGKDETHGLAFVITKEDPFFFFDLDQCTTSAGDAWSPLALQMLQSFIGAAVEVSNSGKGLHILGSGAMPPHCSRNLPLNIELYSENKFITLTGTQATGDIGTDHTPALAQLVGSFFPYLEHAESGEWTTEPVAEYRGPEDDNKLIERILASKIPAGAVFAGKATVHDLWNGESDKLSGTYPPQNENDPFDRSAADAALCQHLAFWTGKNCERIDRLMRESGIYRDKWERDAYREETILRAVAQCRAVYSPPEKKLPEAGEPIIEIEQREGLQYLTPDDQLRLFAGCVYVSSIHRVFTPRGTLLKQEQFRVTYGGYIFAIDSTNEKTTKNAWEAFTESQAFRFPRADTLCFRPEDPPGGLVVEEGVVMLNSYVPAVVESTPGDASPFINHLTTLLPTQLDRDILISYMAACVQYPGTKFQWAPVLQGCEGNGKTLLIKCVSAALGKKYTHLPNAAELGKEGGKFNGWLAGKLFIGIEEIFIGDRRDVSDALKPLITNDRIEFQSKGQDQLTGDNRANFMMCTQHKNAVLKTTGDRRYCLLFTAQQTPADMATAGMTMADGMTPTRYFADLFRWLGAGGYAIVTDYLQKYIIQDQYNPATLCTRAPYTTSTDEAIRQSLGGVEQELIEAQEQGLPGFAGGWLSSMAFAKLLATRGDSRRIPLNRRKEIMAELGYVPHPGLHDGRVNTIIPLDGGKPRLYVKPGSIQAGLTDNKAIVAAYTKAQEPTAEDANVIFNQERDGG